MAEQIREVWIALPSFGFGHNGTPQAFGLSTTMQIILLLAPTTSRYAPRSIKYPFELHVDFRIFFCSDNGALTGLPSTSLLNWNSRIHN